MYPLTISGDGHSFRGLIEDSTNIAESEFPTSDGDTPRGAEVMLSGESHILLGENFPLPTLLRIDLEFDVKVVEGGRESSEAARFLLTRRGAFGVYPCIVSPLKDVTPHSMLIGKRLMQ